MKIKKITKKGNKYIISLEDNSFITTYDEIIINNNILYKKELDNKIISKIKEETNYYDAYNMALKQITIKLRSKQEIENYLIKKNIKDYKKIIKELEMQGYINDEVFTKAFISDKIHLSNDGINKIKKELLKYGVDEDIINNEIDKIDEHIFDEKVTKIINKKINNKDSTYVLKQKITNYLYNLGYDKSYILERLSHFNFDNRNIEVEMEKILSKLSLKYHGIDLENKLKQKLFSKGYTFEEINNFIEKKF